MNQYSFRRRRPWRPVIGIFVLILVIALHGWQVQPAHSSLQPGSPVPVIQDQILGTKPDWMQITLRTLPAVLESGSFEAPADLIRLLGYDPSRVWQAGQTADQYMQLGDFQESFQLQQFSLYEIAALVGLDWPALRLADFALVAWQTLGDLVQAVPDLANRPVESVAPIADLLRGEVDPQTAIAEVLQDEVLASISLKDLNLEQYGLADIPGLMEAPLERFRDWQQSVIDQVPGLADVPFANFPNPIVEQGVVVGQVDVVFGPAEGDRTNTISGSYVEGFNVPCDADCAHLEIGQPTLVEGTQWVSGKYQQVRGGRGALAAANGGVEPTGRHPFGNAFKVAVLETDEASGTAETGLYFRMCVRNLFMDLGCTPYFIGPIPWLPVQEEGMVFLGQIKEGLSTTDSADVAAAKGIDPQTGETRPTPAPAARGSGSPGTATGRFIHPAPGYGITSSFGYRTHPIHGDRRLHSGTDFGTPTGTIIRAADGGQVTFAGISGSLTSGYGRLVVVNHGNGVETYYAHLQGFFVQAGDIIAQGEPVGRANSTGWSTGPHLHFEVRQNGQPQNPMNYLS
ncbi:M23 family metallopeptidase [Nodosilinea sp. LEGE 07088]|uniref:M23 family metallopeptidase n=1 Tax=Nodosilinea sp. LEGE 07088 TaxID=2777968 RepID=UPI00187E87EB|nr:M23 family metallopeptidase [Nodosilinea sp. LEGE 07088]MBE9135717.1 M23 family metallopeptidase [Nodosilinea sp. LEGE 07088]